MSKTMPKDWRSKLPKLVRRPGYAALLTGLIIFTGLWGTLYADEIRGVFPFAKLSIQGDPAVAFWVLVALCAFMYFFRQSADDYARETAQKELIERSESLERIIRTQPPEDFLETSVGLFETADAAYSTAIESKSDLAILESAARHILRVIAILAQKFDRGSADVRYASNIMWFRSSEEISDEQASAMRKDLKFCDPATDIKKLRGVLELDRDIVKSCVRGRGERIPSASHATLLRTPSTKRSPRKTCSISR